MSINYTTRLLKFLNEANVVSKDPEETCNIVNSQCSQFLRLKTPLYKAYVTDLKPVSLEKFDSPKNRVPRLTPIRLYDFINQWLKEHGFAARDSSVITSTEKMKGFFGTPHLLFPIGDFNYAWVNTDDFNMEYDAFKISWFAQLYNERINKDNFEIKDPVKDPEQEILKNLFKTNLASLSSKNPKEVWFAASKGSYSLLTDKIDEAAKNIEKFGKLML